MEWPMLRQRSLGTRLRHRQMEIGWAIARLRNWRNWLMVENVLILDDVITGTLRFWRLRLRFRIKFQFNQRLYGLANNYLLKDCGNFCNWTPPFGFVPEAGCPIHDSED